MALLNGLLERLDDSKHPGTPSVWWAAALAMLTVLLVWRGLWPLVVRFRDRKRNVRRHSEAMRERRQKHLDGY